MTVASFDVVVVGAGITGLTAAHQVLRLRPDARVLVLEASDRVGGMVRTSSLAGHRVDCAADAFLARVPEGLELCRQLGLADALVSPATRSAYVWSRGELRPFPAGVVLGVPTDLAALRASGVVSPAGVARAEADLTMPGDAWHGDESVGSLVRRRLGDEVFERLVAPLLGGVNAGDADRLSVEAGAPQFAAAVRDQPSLVIGLHDQLRAAREREGQGAGGGPDAPVFFGLPSGTQTITDALARAIIGGGGHLQLGRPATAITRATAQGRWQVDTGGGVVDAAAVVVATPDPVTATLLRDLAPAVADELAEVEYASVAMVTVAVPRHAIERELDGSGFLVARPEGLLLTACSWASSKWAHLADPDIAILRASAGRHDDPRALALDDDDLVEAVVGDLARTMGLLGAPIETRIGRWTNALPQFRPGHLDRVRDWEEQLATECGGLIAVGAGFAGLGLPACIRQGMQAAVGIADRF